MINFGKIHCSCGEDDEDDEVCSSWAVFWSKNWLKKSNAKQDWINNDRMNRMIAVDFIIQVWFDFQVQGELTCSVCDVQFSTGISYVMLFIKFYKNTKTIGFNSKINFCYFTFIAPDDFTN